MFGNWKWFWNVFNKNIVFTSVELTIELVLKDQQFEVISVYTVAYMMCGVLMDIKQIIQNCEMYRIQRLASSKLSFLTD